MCSKSIANVKNNFIVKKIQIFKLQELVINQTHCMQTFTASVLVTFWFVKTSKDTD